MRAKWVGLMIAGALALLLVGCSGAGAATVEQAAVAADAAVTEAHEDDGHDEEAVATDTQEADAHDDEAAVTDAHEADGHDDEAVTMLADQAVDMVVDLKLSNFSYEPRLIVANVGDLIRLHVENDTYAAAVPHDFTIEKIDAEMQIISLAGDGDHAHSEGMDMEAADLHFALTEAGIGEVYVRVNEPGDYIFYCTVPGHRALGMEGVLRVN